MGKRKRQVLAIEVSDDECLASLSQSQRSSQDSRSPFERIEEETAFLQVDRSRDNREASSSSCVDDLYFRPRLSDLAVHNKKVREVRQWMENQIGNPLGCSCKVLLLTGPAGVGKKTVVRVLADVLNIELCEWTAPAPILWKEHLHNDTRGSNYSSKLEDFETFLEKTRKYPSLPINASSNRSKLVLIDDIPIAHGEDKKHQLLQCLHRLLVGAKFPTIIVITDVADEGFRGNSIARSTGEIIKTLENGGANTISFNPITANATKKVLTNILKARRCRVSNEMVAEVAEAAAGDIRHAIMHLKFLCLDRSKAPPPGKIESRKRNRSSGNKIRKDSGSSESKVENSESGRDHILSLFHALGKFLRNKRVADAECEPGERFSCRLHEQYQRPPLQMKDPELVISQAHAEASTLISFLHENVTDFIDYDGIEDVADIAQYISDAELVNSRFSWKSRGSTLLDSKWTNTSQLGEAAAASIAARGVLFANTHPAPRRWQALRSPVLWQVERSLSSKKRELYASLNNNNTGPIEQATEYIPFSRNISPFNNDQSPNIVPSDDGDEIENDYF